MYKLVSAPFIHRRALMLVTVDDFLVSPGLVPIKLLTYLHSLMWAIPGGGCSASTTRRLKLVAVTRKVRFIFPVCFQASRGETKQKSLKQINSLNEIRNNGNWLLRTHQVIFLTPAKIGFGNYCASKEFKT